MRSSSAASPLSRMPRIVGDRRQQQSGLEHALERARSTRRRGRGRRIARAVSIASRLLPMPPGPMRLTTRSVPRARSVADGVDVGLAADRRGVGDRHPARSRSGVTGSGIGVAAAARDSSKRSARSMARSPATWSSRSAAESEVEVGGGVVGLDAGDELGEALVAGVGVLDVDELGHPGVGEVVLVLEAGDVFFGSDPPVAGAVDADEHVALREVGPVEVPRRMRAGAQLEHHGRESQALDGRPHCFTFVSELAQGRAHEHPDPLVGCADHGGSSPSHVHIMDLSGRIRHGFSASVYRERRILGTETPFRSACRRSSVRR